MILLLFAVVCFSCVALFTPEALRRLTQRRGLRAPHQALVMMFRAWFGVLALACGWLLLHGRLRG